MDFWFELFKVIKVQSSTKGLFYIKRITTHFPVEHKIEIKKV